MEWVVTDQRSSLFWVLR